MNGPVPPVTWLINARVAGTTRYVSRRVSYAHTTGTTVLHRAKGAVPSIRFPLPSEKLIRAFDLLAAPILTGIQDAERRNETFAALRDTLLPNVISGEQRVLQASNFISED